MGDLRSRTEHNDKQLEKRDREGDYYLQGRVARAYGQSKDDNPLRYVPGKSSPEHFDIWEEQWDLGWDEAEDAVGSLLSSIELERVVELALTDSKLPYHRQIYHTQDTVRFAFKLQTKGSTVVVGEGDVIPSSVTDSIVTLKGEKAVFLFSELIRMTTPWYAKHFGFSGRYAQR